MEQSVYVAPGDPTPAATNGAAPYAAPGSDMDTDSLPGRGDRKSQLPMHSSRKELGKGLVNKILKDLGLK